MTIKSLHALPFDVLIDCFLQAFEHYYIKMPTDPAYYQQRWQAAKVDWRLSYGMFDQDQLVGFIIHGIDHRFGLLTAYNTGTGVIPAYRGRRVAKAIYEYALDDLRQHGIVHSTLEVITENEKAIRAYQSIGFRIRKEYVCMAGAIQSDDQVPIELKEVPIPEIDWTELPNQSYYSWDFQPETIVNGNYVFYQVLHNHEPESYFVIHAATTLLAQFDLLRDHPGGWDRLFTAIKQISATVKLNNVDTRLTTKLARLRQAGLAETFRQYEMALSLPA